MKSMKTTAKTVLTSLALGLALLVAGPVQAITETTTYPDNLSHLALAHHTMVDGWITLNTIASQQQASIDQLIALMEEEKKEAEEEVVAVEETLPAETETVVSAPAVETPEPTYIASVPYDSSHLSPEELEAKEFIAQKESGGSYTARNGIFYGRYQLTESYLNGDLSPENQERVADAYVAERYGSWVAAKAFWLENHWY